MISSRAATLSTCKRRGFTICPTSTLFVKYLKGVLVGRDGGLDKSFGDDKDAVFVPGQEFHQAGKCHHTKECHHDMFDQEEPEKNSVITLRTKPLPQFILILLPE